MNALKRVGVITLSVFAACLLALLLLCPAVNDMSAKEVMNELCRIPLPEGTRRLDQTSQAGKLVGNGNGMQFFGAILIESSLSLEELDEYYSRYRDDEWSCTVDRQAGPEIQIIEHGTLAFAQDPGSSNCYIVYSWGDGIEPFSFFDLRGH